MEIPVVIGKYYKLNELSIWYFYVVKIQERNDNSCVITGQVIRERDAKYTDSIILYESDKNILKEITEQYFKKIKAKYL